MRKVGEIVQLRTMYTAMPNYGSDKLLEEKRKHTSGNLKLGKKYEITNIVFKYGMEAYEVKGESVYIYEDMVDNSKKIKVTVNENVSQCNSKYVNLQQKQLWYY